MSEKVYIFRSVLGEVNSMPATAAPQAQKKPAPAARAPQSGAVAQPAHPAAQVLPGANQANLALIQQWLDSQKPAEQPGTITPQEEASLRKGVDMMAYQLKTQKWTSTSNRDFIIREVRYWCRKDEQYRATTGQGGTPYLDRLLQLLKSRTVNMGDFLADRHMLLYDALWHLLENDEQGEYKSLVKRSRAEGVPPVGPADTGVEALLKSLAVSGLGFVKGASSGLAGVADAATWVASVVTGNKNLQTDLAGKVGKQYNDLGAELLGEYWTDGAEVLFGMNAAKLSSGVGNVALTLALAGSGNVSWLKNANKLKSLAIINNVLAKAGSVGYALTNLKGAGTNIDNLFNVALKINERLYAQRKELTWRDLWNSGEFRMELCNAISNTIGAIAGVPTQSFQTQTWKLIGIYADGLAALGMGDRLIEILVSDLPTDQKQAAAGPLLLEFVAKLGVIMLGKANYNKEFPTKHTIPDMPTVVPEFKMHTASDLPLNVGTHRAPSPYRVYPMEPAPAAPVKQTQPRVDRRKANRLERRAGQLEQANQNAAAREQAALQRQETRAQRRAEAKRANAEAESNTMLSAKAEADMRAAAPSLPARSQPQSHKVRKAEQQRWYDNRNNPADPRGALIQQGLSLDDGKALARAGITPADFAGLQIHTHTDAAIVAKVAAKGGMDPEDLKYLLRQGFTLKDVAAARLEGPDVHTAARLVDHLAGRLDPEGLKRLSQHSGDLSPNAYLLALARHERSGTPLYGDLAPVLKQYGFVRPEERALLRVAAQAGNMSVGERAAIEAATGHILNRMTATGSSPEIQQAVQAYGQQADILRLAYMDEMIKARASGRMPVPEPFERRIERILERGGVSSPGDAAALNALPFEALPARHQEPVMRARAFWESNMRRDVADANGALMHKEVPPGNIPGMMDKNSRFNNAMLSGYWTWDPAVKLMNSPEAAFHQMALGYFNTGFKPTAGERFFMVAPVGPRLAEDFHVPLGPAAAARASGIEHAGKGIGTFPSTLNGHLAARHGLLPEWTWTGPGSQRLPNGARLYRQNENGEVELFAVVVKGRWEPAPPQP